MNSINVKEKLSSFSQQWHPRRIATVDNMQVIVAKISGEFVWHKHDEEDELVLRAKRHAGDAVSRSDGNGQRRRIDRRAQGR